MDTQASQHFVLSKRPPFLFRDTRYHNGRGWYWQC